MECAGSLRLRLRFVSRRVIDIRKVKMAARCGDNRSTRSHAGRTLSLAYDDKLDKLVLELAYKLVPL
jgi:hypothetical protein